MEIYKNTDTLQEFVSINSLLTKKDILQKNLTREKNKSLYNTVLKNIKKFKKNLLEYKSFIIREKIINKILKYKLITISLCCLITNFVICTLLSAINFLGIINYNNGLNIIEQTDYFNYIVNYIGLILFIIGLVQLNTEMVKELLILKSKKYYVRIKKYI